MVCDVAINSLENNLDFATGSYIATSKSVQPMHMEIGLMCRHATHFPLLNTSLQKFV